MQPPLTSRNPRASAHCRQGPTLQLPVLSPPKPWGTPILPLACTLLLSLTLHSQTASPLKAPYNSDRNTSAPLPPAEAARQWRFPDGFEVQVFAAEPDVHQPIAMALDDRGRLWVAEGYTYAEHRTGFATDLRDRIVVFEDTDGDGRHDRRTVFHEGLERLTSIELGFGGVWALASPHLLFIPDRDGDDRPDGPPEPRLEGFEWRSNHHTIANGLRWGPDGWLYGRHGIQGHSRLGPPGAEEAARIKMNVGIWRYHPQRQTVEVVAEGTTNPWGMDWNEVGDAFFINTVIGHLWHIIPGAHYRRMYGNDYNPHIYQVIEQTADHVHWAAGEAWNDWQKLGTTPATSAAGGGHAHTGLLFYNGDNWPDSWRGKLLTINFNGRRLNVDSVVRRGSGYVGQHQPDTGYVADPFFRGIDLLCGPDGGVFIADWSDLGECHDNDGVHRLSGRIYKVTYGRPAQPTLQNLANLSPTELLPLLDAKNEFFSRRARRRFQELASAGSPLPGIRETLRERLATGTNTVARLRALWSLHATAGITPGLLRSLTQDSDPYLRAWAVRLLLDDPRSAAGNRDTHNALANLAATEPNPYVRLALASGLQRLPLNQRPPIAAPLLAHADDASDPNLPQMLWYAIEPLGGSDPAALAGLGAQSAIPFVRRAGARRLTDAERGLDALGPWLVAAAPTPAAVDLLQGMLDALKGRRQTRPPALWNEAAATLSTHPNPTVRDSYRLLGNIFADPLALEATRRLALDPAAQLTTRREALHSLVDARAAGLRAACEQLIAEPGLTAPAAAGLALQTDPGVADILLRHYPKASAEDRRTLLSVLISRATWAGRTLDAVAEGQLARAELNAFHARQIRSLNDPALTAKAATLWGELKDSSAEKLAAIDRWKQQLTPATLKAADRRNGRALYQTLCATCHILNGEGSRIGPELTGSNRDNLDYLLQNIVDPSSIVAKDYQLSNLTLTDGRTVAGVVLSQTQNTLTLQTIAEPMTIPLGDVARREPSTLSMMPEGLLDALTEIQARDLIAYLMDK